MSQANSPGAPLVGAPMLRKEDQRFLVGTGRYTDDINRPHQCFAYFVRSPHAHAKIAKLDASKAASAPGVLAVYTGNDLAAAKVGGLPCGWLVKNKDGSNMVEPPHPALVVDRVRHVGDQVAVVVAETKAQAKAAAQLVDVEYEALPAVAFLKDAVKPGAPLVWDTAKGNTCFLAYFNLGNMYLYQRKLKEAAREFGNAIRLLEKRPKDEQVRFCEDFTVEFLLRACTNTLAQISQRGG